MYIFLNMKVLFVIIIAIINKLQEIKWRFLPRFLQTWEFFPIWLRSLEPFDKMFCHFACCVKMSEAKMKMIKKGKEYYKEKLKRIEDEHRQSCYVSQIQTVQEIIITYTIISINFFYFLQ